MDNGLDYLFLDINVSFWKIEFISKNPFRIITI